VHRSRPHRGEQEKVEMALEGLRVHSS
jgi:hypothetical protein